MHINNQQPAGQSSRRTIPANAIFLSRAEVARFLGIGETTVWKLTKAAEQGRGTFPQPVHFGARCTRWNRAQIYDWAAEVSGISHTAVEAA